MMDADQFSRWMGIQINHVTEGSAELSMTVRAEMVNGFGVCHGGITYSFADSALAFACNGQGRLTMSTDNSIHYAKPVQVGDRLTARAVEISAGSRIAHYQVAVYRDKEVVAHFQGTVYRSGKYHAQAKPPTD